MLFAKLYHKNGNKKEALASAEKAKITTQEMGWDSKEASEILNELKTK